MPPLKHLRASRDWDKHPVGGSSLGVRLKLLRLSHDGFNLPRDSPDDTGGGKDEVGFLGVCGEAMKAREGVWFDIARSGAIRQGKVKMAQEKCPAGLTGVETSS